MPDQPPPRLSGADERGTLLGLLQFQRESVVRKVEGLDDDHAGRAMVPTGTSLLWLVVHLTQAEQLWVEHRFAGLPFEPLDTGERPACTLAEAVAGYRSMWARCDAVVAAHPLDTVCRVADKYEAPSLRWVLAHLLEETARHAGHADILRELLDGSTGR